MELKTLEKKTSLVTNGVQNGDANLGNKKAPANRSQRGPLKPSLVTLTWEFLLYIDLPQVDQHSAFRIGQVLYMEDTSCRFDPF